MLSPCSSSFADLHRFVTAAPFTRADAEVIAAFSHEARSAWVERMVAASDGRFRSWRVTGGDGLSYAAFAVIAPPWWASMQFRFGCATDLPKESGCAVRLHERPRAPIPGGVREVIACPDGWRTAAGGTGQEIVAWHGCADPAAAAARIADFVRPVE